MDTNPWFWGNILFGGVFGSTTDGLSGSVHEYSPSQFFITLVPMTGSPAETEKGTGYFAKCLNPRPPGRRRDESAHEGSQRRRRLPV